MTDLDLPTGTVAFLFTDLEGSTRLLQAHPAAYRDAVRRHHELLRAAVEASGGVVFETVGDAVYAAFARPTDAAAAALAGQRALLAADWGELGTGALKARMGLHLGEVERQGTHYFGAPLYRCARLTATAHGGQTVLSEAAAALVRDALPARAGLLDLGEHRLKDLQRPERVFQLTAPGLPGDFPPLHTLDALPNNLPLQLTSFVGRERELAEVAALLAAQRLLTLTGPGGTGKTRLALQAAADALEAHPDGVWLVELAALRDPALVPQAVAGAVGVREEPGRPLVATLTDALKPRRLLLVLDNCEHLLDACARLADGLLRACPHVRLLATSREALGIAGEAVWRVPSLPIPAAAAGAAGATPPPRPLAPDAGDLTRSAAVRLFADRAAAVRPGFALDAESAGAVAQVCARLDGIPLAIELAAARVRVLPPRQLLARLDDRFRLLTGGSRTALERHQTLQAAVDWSYDLLDEPERALFARLSVFAGGFTLEAAEQVGAGAGVAAGEVLDLLTRLVDRSLVVAEEQGGEARYRLLETLRQYALGKLAASGEGGRVRDRHAAHYLALAEAAAPELRGARGAAWLARLRPELDNLRAALAWAEAQGEADLGLQLAAALLWVWAWHHREEGRAWLARLLALPAPATSEAVVVRVQALNAAGLVAGLLGESAEGQARHEAALALARETGDAAGTGWALLGLGLDAHARGDTAGARALAEQSLAACLEADDRLGAAHAHRLLAMAARAAGDLAGVVCAGERVLALYRELGDLPGAAFALGLLGDAALERGDLTAGRRRYEEALALFRGSADDAGGTAFAAVGLGRVALRQGDHAAARSHFREGLRLYHERGWRRETAAVLAALAAVAAGAGAWPRALHLAGAACGLRETAGGLAPWLVPAQTYLEEALATARRELGEPAAVAGWAAGRAMPLEEAVADALEDPPAPDAA